MYSTCLVANSTPSSVDLVRRVFNMMKKRDVVSWNIMISWYVKTDRFREALKLFRRMMWMGIKPTPVSFVNVFPAASGLGGFKIGNALYGLLVKSGSEFSDDVFAVSSAISMYSQMGSVDLARRVFDGCLEKNVEVWNTMISGYVQNGFYVEALNLFIEALESENTTLDVLTFVTALTAASQLQQLSIGQQFHAQVIKSPLTVSITILNAVVVMYSRCNLISESFKVFDKMTERDTVSWNTMVTALVQNGFDEEGLMLVLEMQKQGFMADSVTSTALLSAASNLRNIDIGKQTHAYLIRRRIQFEGMDGYLIDMYGKCGLIKKAQQLFESTNSKHKDVATWNAMISGFSQNGLVNEAFTVLGQMFQSNILPNAVTIASVLPACSQIGSIALGKQLHGFSIRHSFDHNVFVGTALVDTYSKSGSIASAEHVFLRTQAKNSVTYTSMILGYAQHGMGNTALSLFNSMQNSGVNPDSITFVAVLSACSHSGLVEEGLKIFNSMDSEFGIKPSTEHYCCVVDMLGRVGRFKEAFRFAEVLGKEGNAIRAWGSLLSSCKIHGEYELAKAVGDILLKLEYESGMSGYHVLLSNIYADEGSWEDVDRLRHEMQQRGLRKDVGCSWIEIAGFVSCFMSKDKKHERCEDIYEILGMLVDEMSNSGVNLASQSE